MKTWQVWSEGYEITGNWSDATLQGEVEAETFREACVSLLGDRETFDSKRLTLWGCALYDNETDARKGFG